MLRDQPPGTFVVRDSNSFPGAFGLALKVATPPPNIQGKNATVSDPANELVRHFLIEPTSRGVKLKGCSNEPVFSKFTHVLSLCFVSRKLSLTNAYSAFQLRNDYKGTDFSWVASTKK